MGLLDKHPKGWEEVWSDFNEWHGRLPSTILHFEYRNTWEGEMELLANVMSISGGKDSAAMWIYAVKELGVEVMPVFADTGNEHPDTYKYIDYLERKLGPVRRVVPDFSERILKKRQYVVDHWPRKLTADIPGHWVVVEDDARWAYLRSTENDRAGG